MTYNVYEKTAFEYWKKLLNLRVCRNSKFALRTNAEMGLYHIMVFFNFLEWKI